MVLSGGNFYDYNWNSFLDCMWYIDLWASLCLSPAKIVRLARVGRQELY